MKNRLARKFIAMFFTLCMALSFVPIPAFATEPIPITDVSIVNVNTNLDASKPVAFTAQADASCADKFEVTEETWEAANPLSDIIRSTDETPRAPKAGGEYWYGITLTAKKGYAFSKDFSNIRGSSSVTFTVNGASYSGNSAVSEDSKTLTAWEFMDPVTATESGSIITSAAVENAKFDYQPGDTPQATAQVTAVDRNKYEIEYECWQKSENNNPVAEWYSDNGSHGSLPTITEFESGNSYVYSIMLKPKDGYSFSSETVVTVNGQKVSAPFVGGSMYIPFIKTITINPVTTIDVVEINDVTVSFKDGDKPVFTGKVPDGADYAYRCEWWELDSKTGAMSTDFGNFYENKFTNFEAGKTYHYGVYVTTIYGDRYVFGPDTKLKINGEFVNYKRYEGDTSDGSDGTMWVITDLTMTPQATGEATEYEVIEGANSSWIQNSDETLTFRVNGDLSKFAGIKVDDEWVDKENYIAASGSTIVTLKNEYLKTLSVGEHKITFVYTDGEVSTNFEVKEEGFFKSPKTGDASNILVWYSLFAVSALIVFGITVYNKKKKSIV